ncbi:MAG: hypothetical protein QM278_02585 [Pseudomonadota bacterium]|nr:hypothetical protein [Pseudomonadota bacterium]
MRAVEAVIKVSPDGSAVVNTEKMLKPGVHKILIITDETAILEGNQQRKEKKRLLDLKMIHVQGWPKNSTFRREEIYNDDGR